MQVEAKKRKHSDACAEFINEKLPVEAVVRSSLYFPAVVALKYRGE